jgi:phosphatidylserine/phosphatidylglycerophosphate/cardiolipin synthase-like enzyme
MNTNHVIIRWLTSILIIALLLQFALITPAASAQGEETATPTLADTPSIDVDQDGMFDDIPIESGLSNQQSFDSLNNASSLSSESISIGMIQAGAYTIPRDRLTALGFSVTVIPPTSNLLAFQEYDVIYLPLAWAGASGSDYQVIESHASDYHAYVDGGGGLFVEQPNPCGHPGDQATPASLPYPITFICPYNPDDDPLIVDPNHFITDGLASAEMPTPYDQMTNLDPAYHVLVVGHITGSPSLVVADYGAGRVLVETAHPGYGAIKVFSDEVYRRMINWTVSAYDCSGVALSPIAQAVLTEVNPQEYCGNLYDIDGLIALPPGQDAFERFQTLAEAAIAPGPHEIDFVTMIWDEDENPTIVDTPGDYFLQGIRTLYDDVRQNPENYPGGVRVRILLGLKYYYGTNYIDQRVIVMNDLADLGIEQNALNWTVEVAAYRNAKQEWSLGSDASGIHSHVKTMIVDGKRVIVAGYNMERIYLDNDPTHDMGVQISGPIAQQTLQVFDKLWSEAYRCDLHFLFICASGSITESLQDGIPHDQAVKMIVPTGDDVVFSLFRDNVDKTADNAIAAAIGAAESKVNIFQLHFTNSLSDTTKYQYVRAILDILQKGNGQVRVNLLVSGATQDLPFSVPGICILRYQLWNEDPSGTHYLNTNISDSPTHAKALSIDGLFFIVGSQNFNFTAWGYDEENDDFGQLDLAEYNLGVDSADAARDFDTRFAEEWQNSHELTCLPNLKLGSTGSSTLQDAINQAATGTTIFIPPGVYTETVTINKPLTIVGAGGSQAIFQPESSQPAFRVTSSDVTIMNMKVSGGDGYGIELIDSSPSSLKNIQINRVVFENNAQGGILAQGLIPGSPMNYTIENNTFIGGADGIVINMLESQADTSFIRNNIFSGQTNAPIRVLSTDDSRVEYSYNLFDDCGLGACTANWIQIVF